MIRILMAAYLLLGSVAQAEEYRKVTLANGREIPAQIKAITAEAIELQLAQGTMRIGHADLKNMIAMSVDEYEAQSPWRILILPFETAPGLESDGQTAELFTQRVLEDIEKVHPMTTDDLPDTISSSVRRALALCGTDLLCAVNNGEVAGMDVVIIGSIQEQEDERLLTLGAVFVAAPAARIRSQMTYSGNIVDHRMDLYGRQYEVLALDPPDQPVVPTVTVAPVASATAPDTGRTSSRFAPETLVWAPLPGAPAIARKDYAAVGISMAIVGVGTVAAVHVAGHSTWSAPQMTAMSALTSYGLTVAVNHIFGLE